MPANMSLASRVFLERIEWGLPSFIEEAVQF